MLVEIPPDFKVLEFETQQRPWHEEWIGLGDLLADDINGAGQHCVTLDTGCNEHQDIPPLENAISLVPRESHKDGNIHGTHVTGTIARISPGAKQSVIKVLSDAGSGRSEWIAQGIREAIDMGADIINASLGSSGAYSPTRELLEECADKGIYFVAAAGNAGARGRKNTIGWPARWWEALCIGAIGQDGERASFSSVGREMDAMAPGQNIVGPSNRGFNKYASLSGTSMATPVMSGGLANIRQTILRSGYAIPKNVMELRERLPEFCGDDSSNEHNNREGYGPPRIEEIFKHIRYTKGD